MPTAALYARISQGDKKTPAVASQLANLHKFAAGNGYTVVREYTDDGKSAYSGKLRPGFLDLLLGVERREFEVILAVADDRLARNDEDGFALRSYCVRAGVTWHTIAGGATNPAEASGGLLAKVTLAIAEYESAVKAERIRRSVSDRLARGRDLMGPRPFGFEKDRTTTREAEATVLRAAYAMILEGATLYAVTQMFTGSGLKRDRAQDSAWRPQTVRHILLRERNVGRLVVKGETYAEGLTAIIDTDTFEAVRAILTNPARRPRRGPKPQTWAAVGIVRCGVCGGYLSQTGAQRSGKRNLRCAPDGRPDDARGKIHPTMDAAMLDAALSELVRAHLTPSTFSAPGATVPNPVSGLRLGLAELVRQRDVVQDLALSPGANVADAKKRIAALGQKIEAAQLELDAALASDVTSAAVDAALAVMAERAAHDDREPDADWEATSGAWRDYWSGLSVDDRRALILGLGIRPLLWPRTSPKRLTNAAMANA